MTFGYQERSRADGAELSHSFLREKIESSSHQLSLTIVFTGLTETMGAFREALGLTCQLDARLHILVPHVVPFPLRIDNPRADPVIQLRPLLELCKQAKADVLIDIRLCRDAFDCVSQAQLLSPVILIGARGMWWPFTFKSRLARSLRSAGYEVLLIALSQASGVQSLRSPQGF